MNVQTLRTDYLVIGMGVAGLSFAVKMASSRPDRTVTLLSKGEVVESNTRYAQGGIAVVTDFENDDFEKHIQDTLVAGAARCDRQVVEMVVREGPDRLEEMVAMGTQFDRDERGAFHLGMEGAHSARRILHYKDLTGYQIQQSLLRKAKSLPNIEILEYHFAVDLITQHHFGEKVTRHRDDITCYGVYVMDLKGNRVRPMEARATILASGGAGQVYDLTTNPVVATGDGVAMAHRAKAEIDSMHFIQFHPTALKAETGDRAFLISEAVRGFGAILKRSDGSPFMEEYDERGSLASRDIVARAIDTEMKKSGDSSVFLDGRHLDQTEFRERFPTIYTTCLEKGIDPAVDMIPVAPAAHYLCGGIKTDRSGRTTIRQLYCCGEAASTGLHGANRLASNSLLEALVYAHRCSLDLIERNGPDFLDREIPEWRTEGTNDPKELVLITHNRRELQQLMSDYVGIVRTNERLTRTLKRLALFFEETEELYQTTTLSPQICELRNLIAVAYLIVRESMEETENVGTFYNTDLES